MAFPKARPWKRCFAYRCRDGPRLKSAQSQSWPASCPRLVLLPSSTRIGTLLTSHPSLPMTAMYRCELVEASVAICRVAGVVASALSRQSKSAGSTGTNSGASYHRRSTSTRYKWASGPLEKARHRWKDAGSFPRACHDAQRAWTRSVAEPRITPNGSIGLPAFPPPCSFTSARGYVFSGELEGGILFHNSFVVRVST
jgi:hypothetical protein